MVRTRRNYPLLASDVARSWICIGLFVPILVALPLVVRGGFSLPDGQVAVVTYLVAWSIFAVIYIALSVGVFARADADTLARWLRSTPRPMTGWQRFTWAISGYGAIWFALAGGAVSLIAMMLLVTTGTDTPPVLIWSGVAVLAASWTLIAVSFAVHYAREHAIFGGLEFAGDELPQFSDFLYFALQTSTSAGSDVTVTARRMRHFIALHSIIAFIFNTVIIAVLVAVLIAVVG
ncbi:DUF1345 domain-containing protein [Salinibacterium hongtaonis]|uniref:DUF1345 domain-containing protein n=1 Tax=Homoserinimonas hongtaonis TaxID=2079791 RepID=UPI000D367D0E|nr:DUF1345 domain-containing protein [Salinibacterium hongtaonis]AWB89681.1 hypothetical protein C2138_09115 [Salinibacterium hongtaonis]